MSETAVATAPAGSAPGLIARIAGVVFSPRQTYAAVAAQPRSLGVILLTSAVIIGLQLWFMSTPTGRELALDQQVRAMEAFGMTVTDETLTQLEAGLERSFYITPPLTLVYAFVVNAIIAGMLLGVFTMVLGGNATFKQVYAVAAHSGVIVALQQLFTVPLSLASEGAAGANLGVFVPMLDERSFVALLMGSVDLFLVWWCVSLAIGVAVLYKRRTGPIATGLLGVYAVIALVLAFARSGS